MNTRTITTKVSILAGVLLVGAFLLATNLWPNNPSRESSRGSSLAANMGIPLARPAFAQVSGTTFLDEEAGIAAYTNVGQQIDLAEARSAFRTIERETEEYIVGSVSLPDYPETEDVHAFVHRDGWIVTYYWGDEPVAKIVDWEDYTGGEIRGTKLEDGITVVGNAIGVPVRDIKYYHFRYSSANRLMIVAEAIWEGQGEDTFRIKLPSDFIFYERSYSHYAYGYWGNQSSMYIDGERISYIDVEPEGTNYGLLSPSRLPVDEFRTIKVTEAYNTDKAFGAIVLVYQEP